MTPVISALKKRFPTAEIDVLLYQETMPILSRNPQINKIWGLQRSLRGGKKLLHYVQLFSGLSSRKFDWVIHLSDQWNGAVLSRVLHHGEAVGIAYPRRLNGHWEKCFTRLTERAADNSMHAVEQNLLALKPLGIEVADQDKRCTMAIARQDREQVRVQLDALGVHDHYIVVHPAARWFFKCWEDDRFAEVIQTLANEGWTVILTGAPNEQEMQLVDSILSKVRSENVYSLAGKLSLNTLAALIEGARLFIGVDSAPMHMAAALQIDTVALFGPSKLNEWHPWMTRYIMLSNADFGEQVHPDSIDTSTHRRYLAEIPTQAVMEAVQSLLHPTDRAESSQKDASHHE